MTQPLLLERLLVVHRALEEAGLDHAVGGAIALATHTRHPRFTADIDLNITVDEPHDPSDLLAALPAEVDQPASTRARLRDELQARFWWEGSVRTPLDLFLPAHPTFHRAAVDRAVPAPFLGGVKVLTATDLMVFKALFNRSKDWVDIETLVEDGRGDVVEAAAIVRDVVGDSTIVHRLLGLRSQQPGRG